MRERERASELSESRVFWPLPRSRSTALNTPGTSRTFAQTVSQRGPPQSWRNRKVNANGEREFGTPPRGRAPNANALVAPDGLLRQLLRQLLRTPTPRCSGPREPGGAAASIARRGRFERPRRALAPARLPRPPSSEGRVGELHAHRDGVRAAASRSSPRSRACPPRMRRSRSGRRPVKRGGRNERLDGQGRVSGRRGRQGGGAPAADRAWRERQLAQS